MWLIENSKLHMWFILYYYWTTLISRRKGLGTFKHAWHGQHAAWHHQIGGLISLDFMR